MKSLILSALFLSSTAFADMNGTYQVLNDECAPFMLSTRVKAVVKADDTKLQVGVVHSQRFMAAFDYAVGTVRKGCLGDCYYLNTGSYSADGAEFKEVFMYARFHDEAPVYHSEVTFTLSGDELEINNGSKQCLLKKI
jgi:hypothetical protein